MEPKPQFFDKLLVGLFIVGAIVSLSTSAYLWNRYFHRPTVGGNPSKTVQQQQPVMEGKNSPENLKLQAEASVRSKTNVKQLSIGYAGTIVRFEDDTLFIRGDTPGRGQTEPLKFPVLVTDKTEIIRNPPAPSPIPSYPLPETLDTSLRVSTEALIPETRVIMYVYDPDDELENYDGTIEMKKKPEALLIILLSAPSTASTPPTTPSARFSDFAPTASPSAF